MTSARSPRWHWLLIGLFVLASMSVRVIYSGTAALERGQEALLEGDEVKATIALREAVSWYLPFASWRAEATTALWALYEAQLGEERLADAARTLQSLRSGLWAADSIIRPNGEDKSRVDAALAPLMARWEQAAALKDGRSAPGSLAERERYHAQLLAADERPDRGWGLLIDIAMVGFALCVKRGVNGSEGAQWRWALLAVVCVAGVLFGVSQA